MNEEHFLPLPGWPKYRVSNIGRVFGPRNHVLAGYRDKDGYHCVALGPRGKSTGLKVHRLVVSAFIGPIPDGLVVNHKNGIKDDNRIDNLEVVTISQNTKHGFSVLGRRVKNTNPPKGTAHHNAKLNEDIVRAIRALYLDGWSQDKIAAKFGTPQTNVSSIVRRVAWAHVPD